MNTTSIRCAVSIDIGTGAYQPIGDGKVVVNHGIAKRRTILTGSVDISAISCKEFDDHKAPTLNGQTQWCDVSDFESTVGTWTGCHECASKVLPTSTKYSFQDREEEVRLSKEGSTIAEEEGYNFVMAAESCDVQSAMEPIESTWREAVTSTVHRSPVLNECFDKIDATTRRSNA
jgi:hypothetical protein